MNDLIVLYYEPFVMKADQFKQLVENISNVTEKKVVALPKSFDLLLEASTDQLVMAKSLIEQALAFQMEKPPATEIKQ